jgi:murein DD-endopeptidase MepM/ murein hydrolase activator NlpD
MDRYSLIVVSDGTSPIRRLDVRKTTVRRAVIGAGVAAAVALGIFADYVRVRLDRAEVAHLRELASQQQATIQGFESVVGGVEEKLARIAEFERKVRVIANLPGSAATGGADVSEMGPSDEDGAPGAHPDGQGGDEELLPGELDGLAGRRAGAAGARAAGARPAGERVGLLRLEAERLGLVADARAVSLKELVEELEDKHQRLDSSPAIWPARGWLTSRFGDRISPFTGRRQFHAGIDIASGFGTEVVAPARGRVEFVGAKGPLGNLVVIDHGYGIRTQYGHNARVHVKSGEVVERGQVIAAVGNSGRSTGPHLHYVVEVNGKAVNPLDFIFD